MQTLTKNSTKPMTIGVNNSQTDIKKVIFSRDGDKIVSIDNVLSAKIWDESSESLIRQLKGIRAQYASFTPDDSKLIILYRASIHVINMTDLSQIQTLDNGINIYGGDCSPDNLYFAHSNNSNIYLRNVQNMQLVNKTNNGQCDPYYVQFGQDNFLYTSSLDNGIICKWNVTNLEILKKISLNSKIHDIGISPNYLVVSSENNLRNIYFISLREFSLNATYSVPSSRRIQDYDNNKQIHCSYNFASNVFMCVSKAGRYLFLYNGTTTQYIGNKTLQNFTGYTVDYNDITDALVFGGQFVNSLTHSYDDQIAFYSLQYNCSQLTNTVARGMTQSARSAAPSWIIQNSQCPCIRDYIWNSKIGQCERLTCQNNNILYNQEIKQSQCVCPKQNWWDYQVEKCQINCFEKQNTLRQAKYPFYLYDRSIEACPCQKDYRWDMNEQKCQQFKCNRQGTTGKYSKSNLNQCQCFPKFYAHQKNCILNCSAIQNAQNSNSYLDSLLLQQKCQCQSGFQWVGNSYQCQRHKLLEDNSISDQTSDNQFPIISIIAPISAFILLAIICLASCFLYRKCRKTQNNYEKDVVASSETGTQNSEQPKIIKKKISFHQQILKKLQSSFKGQKDHKIIRQEESEKKSPSLGTQHDQISEQKPNCVACSGPFPDISYNCDHEFHKICLKSNWKNSSQSVCPICSKKKLSPRRSPRQNAQNIEHYVIEGQQNIEKQKEGKKTPRRRRH